MLINNKDALGIRVGNAGVGIIKFPWLNLFGAKKHEISFWTWLFCPPQIRFDTVTYSRTYIQVRFMWFIMQIMGEKRYG
jgi:hypothetical protein